MPDNRTHRGLSTYGVECGRRVEVRLFDENSGPAASRMAAIRRRSIRLPLGHPQGYPESDQDRDQVAFGSVNNYHPVRTVCSCDMCEDHRRGVLVRAHPSLRLVGLSPKNEEEL